MSADVRGAGSGARGRLAVPRGARGVRRSAPPAWFGINVSRCQRMSANVSKCQQCAGASLRRAERDECVAQRLQPGSELMSQASANVSICQQMSAHFSKCQQCTGASLCRAEREERVAQRLQPGSELMSADVSRCQQMSANVSKCQQMSANRDFFLNAGTRIWSWLSCM